MADLFHRYPQNVIGAFYVDDQCIDCDMCRLNAPNFFTRDDEGAHSYVFRQPVREEEIALCLEAVEDCPVAAIGDDGGEADEDSKNPSRLSDFVRQ